MKTIEFYFDFASPNCYFAQKALPQIAGSAPIVIKPVLLGGIFKLTNNQAPMIAFANVKGKVAYDMLEIQRFIERYKISAFKMNPNFPINTVSLMRGMLCVDEDQQSDYIERMQCAMWEDGKNMNDPAVVAEVWAEGGFDAPTLQERIQTPEIKKELAALTDAAVERGIFGLPAFFVDGEMFFGKERLGQVAEAAGA